MIQLITGDYQIKSKYQEDSNYCVSDFKNPKDFDEFDINVLDLSFSQLWENKGGSKDYINMDKDISHYSSIIENTSMSKILVVLPQNIHFKYNYSNGNYKNFEYLKNLLQLIQDLVFNNICSYKFKLEFATTQTNFKNSLVSADFYFSRHFIEKENVILVSDKSNKVTTVLIDKDLYYTTLNICDNKESLEEFLIKTKILCGNEFKKPEWIKNVNILNDIEVKDNIQKLEEQIVEIEEKKEIEKKKLEENDKIKSILYQTDKSLQIQVIEILNEMLDYKDDNFMDNMEEDYKIKKENITFIIETKGLSRNISGTDVNKTLNHVIVYEEKLEKEKIIENVKGIFIVATQRERDVVDRDKLPDRQIIIAKRNNILIIRTEELLKVFEAFRNEEITTDKVIEQFKTQIGEYKFNKE